MMKKYIFLPFILALAFFLPCTAGAESKTDNVREVMNMILDNYKGELTREELEEAAIKGMFSILDKNSSYYKKDSIVPVEEGIEEYVGIGARIAISGSKIVIEEAVKGSPAEVAGLKKGDEITMVDGIEPMNMPLDEIVFIISGPANSAVKLTINRHGIEKEFTVTRKKIRTGNAIIGKVENAAKGIKYVELKNFNNGAYQSFSEILRQSERDGTKGLIIDLRNNKGGILTEVVKICQSIVPKGTVVRVKDKTGQEKNYDSYLESRKFEIAVLVNKNSASASEILASSVKESGAGKIIGENTYGKGTVQKVFKDKGGNYLKITTGEYFTRNGNRIDGIGLKPDIEVKDQDEKLKQKDSYIDKAIEYLSAKIKN